MNHSCKGCDTPLTIRPEKQQFLEGGSKVRVRCDENNCDTEHLIGQDGIILAYHMGAAGSDQE